MSQAAVACPLDGESFWTRLVPRSERSAAWLERTAADLERAAQAWMIPFTADQTAIHSKLNSADTVAVFEDAYAVAGFVAAREPFRLPRTGLRARYIEGAIVHPYIGGPGKFRRLMSTIGDCCDLEVAHTQSAHMYKSFEDRNEVTFPARTLDRRLNAALMEDMREFLAKIGRSADFDLFTGIVPNLYEHRLYKEWPFPGNAEVPSLRALPDEKSGILVVAFQLKGIAQQSMTYRQVPGEGS